MKIAWNTNYLAAVLQTEPIRRIYRTCLGGGPKWQVDQISSKTYYWTLG